MDNIIIYDFDGTLTPNTLPKFEILEKCGLDGGASNIKFLELVKENAKNMDFYEAIYRTYFRILEDKGFKLIDENFSMGAERIEYNKGVEDFLKLLVLNNVKNYLLSSGLLVFLEKTNISKYFEKIYATTFKYNKNNEVCELDYLMSDKAKVDAIKKILLSNNKIDCQNVCYIGDGFTDFYAMKYVKDNGGKVIFVCNDENNKDIEEMKKENIVDYFFEADYRENTSINNCLKKLCNIK